MMNISDVELYFYLPSNIEKREYISLYNNCKKDIFMLLL